MRGVERKKSQHTLSYLYTYSLSYHHVFGTKVQTPIVHYTNLHHMYLLYLLNNGGNHTQTHLITTSYVIILPEYIKNYYYINKAFSAYTFS